MKILLVGHGKMGQLVGSLAPQYGSEVAGVRSSCVDCTVTCCGVNTRVVVL